MFRTLAAAALGITLAAPALPVLAQQPESVPVAPAEATTEIALTELLNELFQMGFVSELNSIERVGSSYIVDVTTIDFERVRLELNAVTGTISQL